MHISSESPDCVICDWIGSSGSVCWRWGGDSFQMNFPPLVSPTGKKACPSLADIITIPRPKSSLNQAAESVTAKRVQTQTARRGHVTRNLNPKSVICVLVHPKVHYQEPPCRH